MSLSLPGSDIPWLDITCVVAAVTLLEGAATGKGTTRSRQWPVAARLRPIFAVLGFALLAFGLVDFVWKFTK